MMELKDDMLLYHGSYCEVRTPELKRCAKFKDFGQGFYLTSSRTQAESFAKTSTRKAIANGIVDTDKRYGALSVFQFKGMERLLVKTFPTADNDWLHCVVGHRKKKFFFDEINKLKNCDVIAGKIANDNTNATITTYMAGAFGEPGTESADQIAISLLLWQRLQDQFCFRTSRAIQCLTFKESEQIWL